MNAWEFCKELAGRISQAEWDALEQRDPSLTISDHNRRTLLELRALCTTPGAADERMMAEMDVDLDAANDLSRQLQEYLDEYMPDAPEGHKWIVLASLYLAFVARRPLHPIERTGVLVEQRNGTTVYRCPLKQVGDNPICDACVCLEK